MGREKEVNKRVQVLKQARLGVQQAMIDRESDKKLNGLQKADEALTGSLDRLNLLMDHHREGLKLTTLEIETLEKLENDSTLEAWTAELDKNHHLPIKKIDWNVVLDESKIQKMNDEIAKFARRRDKTPKSGLSMEQKILKGRWNGVKP